MDQPTATDDDLAAGAAHFARHGWLLTRTLDDVRVANA